MDNALLIVLPAAWLLGGTALYIRLTTGSDASVREREQAGACAAAVVGLMVTVFIAMTGGLQ